MVDPYSPSHDFAGDPAPQNQVDAAALQAEFQNIAAASADVIAWLSSILRVDGTLVDAIVRLRNLHPELATLIDTYTTGTTVTNSLVYRLPVRAASTANVANLFDHQTVDGVALVSGDRVLLKNQTISSQNGIWIVWNAGDPAPNGAGLWVRATDLPAAVASGSGWAVCVEEGTVNGETAWMPLTGGDTTPVVGTDPLAFMPVFAPFPLPVARGGTGATTAAAARTNLGVPGKATTTINGTGVATVFSFAHNLGTEAVVVSVKGVTSGTQEEVTITIASATTIQLTFNVAPGLGDQYLITVIG